MKILLTSARRDFARFIPLGVAYLASFLEKEGHNVRVWDELPHAKPFRNLLEEFNPDIVGVSCMTATLSRAEDLAKEVKNYNKNIPVIFGGIHPTSAPQETLKEDFIDFITIGEGELTFAELLKELEAGGKDFSKIPLGISSHFSEIKGLAYKKDGKVIINEKRPLIQDLDAFPLPARHLFDMDYYTQRWNWPRGHWLKTANLMSSRGCPYSCTYCASKIMFGMTFRAQSVEKTVAEVDHLVEDYGFECMAFSDDTFAIDKKRAVEIAREMHKRHPALLFRVQLRANTCDEDMIAEFKAANCIQVDIGVESGSERVLKIIDKKITVDQIKKAFAVVKKYGIGSSATFIIGVPGETAEDIEDSRRLAEEIDSDYTQFFILTPYPGTPVYNFAKENNLFLNPNFCMDDFRHGGENLKPLLKVALTPEQLIETRDKLNSQFVDKAVTNFLNYDNFIKDLSAAFIDDPEKFREFTKVLKETGNVGRALKTAMPHKL
jgi:anaerobic magnesium-protoporphyrin IX monomethyl ester cyclase